MTKVVISSTGLDLSVYRQAAIETCNKLGMIPIAMEFFESMGVGACEGSKLQMREADVYVGIYAHRYGYIEAGHKKSVTEVEFDYAEERQLERLCFVIDGKHPWPPDATDFKNYRRLKKFKTRLDNSVIRTEFTTVDDFKAKLMHSLTEWRARNPGHNKRSAADDLEVEAMIATAPPRPALVIGREEDLSNLKVRFGIGGGGIKRDLTIIRGLPGVGKTTIVNALAHDDEIVAAFPGGVLWTAVGEAPDPFAGLSRWWRALTRSEASPPQTLEKLMAQVRALLSDQRTFLIIDDVWKAEDAAPFKVAGSGCVTLITTRFQDVANTLAITPDDIYLLGQLSHKKGLELLARLAPTVFEKYPGESSEIVDRLEGLPLAIRVAGRLLEAEANRGSSVDELVHELTEGTRLLGEVAPDDRYDPVTRTIPSVSLLLKKSTDRLDETTRRRFAHLGPQAPKPATFDLNLMRYVWKVKDARPTAFKLADRGLLEPIIGTGRFQMHALLVMHAKSLLKSRSKANG